MQLAGLPAIGLAVTAGSQGMKAVGHFAGMLRDALTPGSDEATSSQASPAGESAPATDLKARLARLEERIRGLLAEAGFPTAGPLVLTQDAFDRVRVVGGTGPLADVESVLSTHPEIGDELRAIAEAAQGLDDAGQSSGLPPVLEIDGKPTFEWSLPDRSVAGRA